MAAAVEEAEGDGFLGSLLVVVWCLACGSVGVKEWCCESVFISVLLDMA